MCLIGGEANAQIHIFSPGTAIAVCSVYSVVQLLYHISNALAILCAIIINIDNVKCAIRVKMDVQTLRPSHLSSTLQTHTALPSSRERHHVYYCLPAYNCTAYP